MKNSFDCHFKISSICVLIIALYCSSCSPKEMEEAPEEHSSDMEQHEQHEEGEIVFTLEQQERIALTTTPAIQTNLAKRIRVPAQVLAKPGYATEITAGLAGTVVTLSDHALPGQRVKAGDVLAQIRPIFSGMDVTSMEANYIQNKSEYELAQAQFERIEKLAQAGARSQREVEEARATLLTAQAKWSIAMAWKASYDKDHSTPQSTPDALPTVDIYSPLSGTVSLTLAGKGQRVEDSTVLFSILDTSKVWISASLTEAKIKEIRSYQETFYENSDGTFKPLTEASLLIRPELDPVTRMGNIYCEVENSDNSLLVGQTLNLHLCGNAVPQAIAVPDSAILEEGGEPIVFVKEADEHFEKRYIQTGIRDRNWVEITKGVEAGELVVNSGAYPLKLASNSNALPDPHAGHHH